jgi:hypothetical protein
VGSWLRFFLGEYSDGQFHALATFADSSPQEQSPQVLFYRAWTDVELACNFLVAAALDEQVQHLPIAGRHFNLIETYHALFLLGLGD